jgi:hypothetical protein
MFKNRGNFYICYNNRNICLEPVFFQDILRSIGEISYIFQTINLINRELGEVDLKTAQVLQEHPIISSGGLLGIW